VRTLPALSASPEIPASCPVIPQREDARYLAIAQSGLLERLAQADRLRPQLSPAEALAVIWAMSGDDLYSQLVFRQKWSPARYEEWLADALVKVVLKPAWPRTTKPHK